MSIETSKDNDRVEIVLDSRLYDLGCIKDTLNDFADICSGEISEQKNQKIKIVLKPKKEGILDELGYEFCNYSLGLMKNKLIV